MNTRWSDPEYGKMIAAPVQDPKCAFALATMKIAFVLGVLQLASRELGDYEPDYEGDVRVLMPKVECWREWLDDFPLPCKCGTCYRVATVAHRKGTQVRIRYEDLPKNPTTLRVKELIESRLNQGVVQMLPELVKFWDNSMEAQWQATTGSSQAPR